MQKMHADEQPVDAAVVRSLLEEQFPDWAGLKVERVPSFGTDNALYRLGDQMVVRLPRIEWATRDIGAGPLAERDAEVRRAIGEVADEFDPSAVEAAWDDALRAPAWDGPPVWTHGDLLRGNLSLRDGRLVLPRETRQSFRADAGFDGATWARGRGWALCCGLLQIPYYSETNPELADNGRHMVRQILAETNVRS